jgi:hypothetical protein
MDPNASANNVVPLKPSPLQGELLHAVRASTLQVLPPILSGVLSGADDALFDLVQKSHSTFEQQQFFDAMRELRRQRGAIEQRYRDHFGTAFQGLERRKPVLAHYAQPGETSNELSLLDEEELEEQLASEQVAQAVERRHSQVLLKLDQQLGIVAGGVQLNGMLNPVGPGHMAASMRAGLRGCDLASSARLVLFKLYEQALLPALAKFYADISQRLTAAGVVGAGPKPAPRVEATPSVPHATPQEPFLAPQAPRRDEGRMRDDLFAALHGLLEDYRAAQRATGNGPLSDPGQSSVPPLAVTETLTVLSLLQRELPPSFHAAVDDPKQSLSGQLKRELMAQAERMGVGMPGAPLTPGDEDAIDLVGMLFEVLLNERKFQDPVRRMLTQMIVPFAKVAMLDRRMFMHKTHPARRMLNSVTEACDGNTGETALERELLERVDGLVNRLVAEFNEDLAIFETLQEEFSAFLEQHRKRVELAERRAAEAQRGRERLEQARAVASMELAMLMGAREAPPVVDGFLRRYWTHHLALVILRDGTDSERFAQARAVGERVWQMMLAAEAGRGREDSLPELLEPVLASSGVTGEAAVDVVVSLQDLFDMMRRGDRAGVDGAVLPGSAVADPGPSEAAAVASQGAASNVVPLRPVAESPLARAMAAEAAVETTPPPKVVERDTAAQFASFWAESEQAPAAPPAPVVPAAPAAVRDASPPGLSVVGGTDAVAADPADVEKIRKLEVGNWVEMIGEDGSAQPAKLSWVSPISNRLLFVNRRGMRVCAASAEELAVMLKQGKLSLREIDTAFERAMTQVLGKLRESQGQRGNA